LSPRASTRRSIATSISYRLVVVCLDFPVIDLLTGQLKIALGFMLVSNLYTTLAYFLHERIWARIRWGTAAADESAA
jgi:adenylylsulfate kinase